jgi:hypothetical protein
MIFTDLVDTLITFFQNNLIVSIAISLILLFLLFRRTKLFLVIVIFASLLAGTLYVISSVSSTGLSHKDKLIHKSNR